MKKLFALVLLVSSVGFANTEGRSNFSYSMAGIEGGFKWASAEGKGSSSNKQVIGYSIGGSVAFDIVGSLAIKTGLFYNERPFEFDFAGTSAKGKITYVDVPALLMFKFEDYAGIYIGPSLSMKLGDEISPGTLSGIKGTVMPITFGGQFKFAPNFGVNAYYETVSGDVADGISNSRAVGVNLLITLD